MRDVQHSGCIPGAQQLGLYLHPRRPELPHGPANRVRVQAEDDIGSNIKRALDSNAPALVEVPITRDVSVAAAEVVGWWDFPVLPTASDSVKADYKAGYAAEQHSCSTTDVELTEPVSATG